MGIPTSIFQWEANTFPVFEERTHEMVPCLWLALWVIRNWM